MIKDKKEKQSGGSSASASSANSGSSGGGNNAGGGSSGGSNSSKSNNSNANSAANSSSTSGNNNASTSSPSSSSKTSNTSSSSSTSSGNKSGSSNASNKIKEEIIEQDEQKQAFMDVIVTSIKHEDGSPPTNIIKKEPANPSSSSSAAGGSGSGVASGSNPGSSSTSTVNSNDSNNNNDTNDNKNSNNLSGNPDEKDSANENSIKDELLNDDDLNSSGGNNSSSNKLGLHHIKSEQDPMSDPLAGVDSSFGQMNSQPGSNRPMMSQTSPERIQPLPSNIVNKSNSMDYMQQQSQIFVFSTGLANKGAEAVRNGLYPTIIAYHCAQPETRKILSKFPLKMNQFNRSPQWFPPNMPNSMNPTGNKRIKMNPMNQQQNFNFINKNNNPMNPQQQQQQQQQGPGGQNQMGGGMQMQQGGFQGSCDMNMGPNDVWSGPGGNQQMNMDPLGNGPPSIDPLLGDSIDSLVNDPLASTMSNLQGGGGFMDPASPSIPSLQGVKVPDEDLTPQQRQDRAKKLKQLEELKAMLKQDHPLSASELQALAEQDILTGPISNVPSGGAPPNQGPQGNIGGGGGGNIMQGGNMPCNNKMPMNPMMQVPQGNMMNNPHGPMNPGMNMNGPMRPNFGGPMGPMGPRGGGPGNMGMRPQMNMNPDEMMMGGNGGPMGGNMHMGGHGPGPNMGMNMGMNPHMQGGGNNMGMNNMCMMPGGPNMMQKGMGPMNAPGGGGNMHMDWNKMQQQQQYYDDKRKGGPPMDMPPMNEMNMGMGGPNRMGPGGGMNRNMPNMRLPQQGPPPPYHQTPRSASVPIATQSPNPNSPNNPTSNLSLPSPRGGCNSTLNSPAAGDPSRMNPQQFKHMNPRQSPTTSSQDSPAGAMGRQINHSNPSTPISSHLSPSASLKDLEMSTNPNKEPNLMPVPSPQQISYLNTFEGQELTIQKQPNTNINKDGPPNMIGPNQANMNLDNRLPGQKTPTSTANPHMNNFSIPSSPHTPGAPGSLGGDKNRINPSPQGNLQRSNSMMGNDPTQQQFPPQHMQGNPNQQSNESNMPFPTDSPFGPNSLPPNNSKMPNFMDQKPGDMPNGPPQFPPCGGGVGRPENLPLNPNSNVTMPNTKPSHFDPISSLAQMSQQLTSTGVPNPMNGQAMMPGFNNNGMMNDMGPMMGDNQMDFGGNMPGMGGPNQFAGMPGPRSMSPKMPPQMNAFGPGPGMPPNMRMVRPPPMGYNGTNIQVKPNAPNTIQYLPARPNMNNSNPPRGPPSLEFLQRYTNPMGMDEMNKGGGNQQMPYFPNQQNNPGSCGGGMDPLGDVGGGNGGPGMLGSGPGGMMNQNPMMMRGGNAGMRGGPGNMMRFPSPGGGGGNPCMMGNNSFNSSNNQNMGPNEHQQMMMFGGNGGGGGGGPNQNNPQMFVPGPKSSPIGPPPGGVVNSDMQMGNMGPMGGGMNVPNPGGQPHFNKQPQQQQQQQQQGHFPSTADPNYAQQYHNFQQQLYATNNANQRNQMGMQNQAFMPK